MSGHEEAARRAYEELASRIGAWARAMRAYHDLTVAEASVRIGLSETTVHDVENGTANLRLRTLAKLAEGYGCAVSVFVSEGPKLPATEADE